MAGRITEINNPLLLWALQLSGWLITICSLILVFVNIPIFYDYVLANNQLPVDSDIIAWARTLLRRFGELLYFTVAIGILLRSREPLAILIAIFSASLGAMYGGSYVEIIGQVNDGIFLLSSIVAVIPAPIGVMLLFVLPDGEFSPGYGRWLVLALAILEPIRVYFSVTMLSYVIGYGMFIPTLAIAAIGVRAQMKRYAVGTPVFRQQFKWIIFGAASVIAGIAILILTLIVIPAQWHILTQGLDEVGGVILAVCLIFAVTRYRLYDIDLIINRVLVYGSSIVGLGLLAVGLFALIQQILVNVPVLGRVTAVILSVIIVSVLLKPTVDFLQHWIDTRIYGLRFDLNQLEDYVTAPGSHRSGEYQGETISGYQLMNRIAIGGLTEVYLATQDGELYAVKILLEGKRYDEGAKKQFQTEVRITGKLDHPNLVKMKADEAIDRDSYLILHYVAGETVSWYVEERTRLSFEDVVCVLEDVVEALEYIHKQGIVHRDLKPGNVIISESDQIAILVDFGLAMYIHDSDGLEGTIGTIAYMSPEQIQEGHDIDHRTDIYALGVMAYQMLTGKLPFDGGTGRILFGHLHQPPPDPLELNPDIPLQASLAIQRAMSKDMTDRYQSAREFLETFCSTEAVTA